MQERIGDLCSSVFFLLLSVARGRPRIVGSIGGRALKCRAKAGLALSPLSVLVFLWAALIILSDSTIMGMFPLFMYSGPSRINVG